MTVDLLHSWYLRAFKCLVASSFLLLTSGLKLVGTRSFVCINSVTS